MEAGNAEAHRAQRGRVKDSLARFDAKASRKSSMPLPELPETM